MLYKNYRYKYNVIISLMQIKQSFSLQNGKIN